MDNETEICIVRTVMNVSNASALQRISVLLTFLDQCHPREDDIYAIFFTKCSVALGPEDVFGKFCDMQCHFACGSQDVPIVNCQTYCLT